VYNPPPCMKAVRSESGTSPRAATDTVEPCFTVRSHQVSRAAQALRARLMKFEDETAPWIRGLAATRVYRDSPDMPAVLKRAASSAATMRTEKPVLLLSPQLQLHVIERMEAASSRPGGEPGT